MGRLRQTDRQAKSTSRGRQTHNMSVSLKSNTGSTFPEASLPGQRAPISLPSVPSRALGRDPEDSVPLAWSNPASGSAFVTCSSAPHGHREAGQPPLAGGGKPGPPQPPLPALLPSLPLSRPPSLSPSLPPSLSAARGALLRATCSGPNPGISEREKKERTSYVGKKERPLTAFIFHVLTLVRP